MLHLSWFQRVFSLSGPFFSVVWPRDFQIGFFKRAHLLAAGAGACQPRAAPTSSPPPTRNVFKRRHATVRVLMFTCSEKRQWGATNRLCLSQQTLTVWIIRRIVQQASIWLAHCHLSAQYENVDNIINAILMPSGRCMASFLIWL